MASHNYGDYIRGLYQLHRLWEAGLGESPQADQLRDRMDQPEYALTEAERIRAGEFSEDLYLVHEGKISDQVLHSKSGGVYDVLPPGPAGAVIDATNCSQGRRLVAYRSAGDRQLYVREEAEFQQPGRFQRLPTERGLNDGASDG